VLSRFAGIRPLVKAGGSNTAKLSRDFAIRDDVPGLFTIAGGKWTTYRAMAEACVDRAAAFAGLPEMPCGTKQLSLHGYTQAAAELGALSVYGTDAREIQKIGEAVPALATPLDEALPYTGAEVLWAVRAEMARRVDDVLARRTRALFLNANAAVRMAPRVAKLMAAELGRDDAWEREQVLALQALARGYGATA
jgi:glycerol-3-phosphate dehydrogenase